MVSVLLGNFGVLGGREGLKLELEGTRLGCWAVDFPVGLGFVGDGGREGGRGFEEEYVLKDGLDFVGLGDGGTLCN